MSMLTVKRVAIGLTSLTAIVAGFGLAATPPSFEAASSDHSSPAGLTIHLEPTATPSVPDPDATASGSTETGEKALSRGTTAGWECWSRSGDEPEA